MRKYDEAFFSTFQSSSRSSAEAILPHLLSEFRVTSVVDVGCGLGIWLDVARAHGVTRILGIDGGSVDLAARLVRDDEFRFADLSDVGSLSTDVRGRYDLAICLEVAEHLPESSASDLVAFLCERSSVVLFGAAIPFQGGTGHQNEQWPDYWARHFEDRGFLALDRIRPTTWDDIGVSWWYAQNALLYVERTAHVVANLTYEELLPASQVRRLVHPDLYLRHADPEAYTARRAAAVLAKSLGAAVTRRLGLSN